MRIHPVLLLCMLLLFQCGGQSDPDKNRPENVLKEERFKEVLLELYLLEAEGKYRETNFKEAKDSILAAGTQRVLKEHGTERRKFVRSFKYYMKDPERMERIHEEVVNELMRKKEEGKKN